MRGNMGAEAGGRGNGFARREQATDEEVLEGESVHRKEEDWRKEFAVSLNAFMQTGNVAGMRWTTRRSRSSSRESGGHFI